MHELGNNFIHEKRSLLDYVHLLRDNIIYLRHFRDFENSQV